MDEHIVVVTKDGFLTDKKLLEVLETDEVMPCRGTTIECNNFIHGINPKQYEKSFNDDSNFAVNDELRTVTAEA